MSFFNILPGSGLGFTGSKQIAFGLGAMSITKIVPPVVQPGGGGYYCTVIDNPYSHRQDDEEEIVAILTAIIGVIEI